MNILRYLMESRGPLNAMHRLPRIVGRFGLTSGKIEAAVNQFVSITASHSCTPTLTVTAIVLERNANFFRELSNHAELAVHGYVHTDYSLLAEEVQMEHMQRALAIFHEAGIQPSGFRCPYFRWNSSSVKVAAQAGLQYGSNGVIAWPVVAESTVGHNAWLAYEKGLNLYNSHPWFERLNLPDVFEDILLDIPASLPDDEAIVDRLQLGRAASRDEIWPAMLDLIHERGELFTLSLHNERVPICAGGLDAVLQRAGEMKPGVWVAPLREIADWWTRRRTWRLDVRHIEGAEFELSYPVSEGDLTLVARGAESLREDTRWFGDYHRIETGTTRLRFPRAPLIEVAPDCSPRMVLFLQQEGFAVGARGSGGLSIEGFREFREEDKRPLLDLIEASDAPLVRLWRWPRSNRSALSITGDIDSMTLIDFFRRPFEV